LVINFFLQSPHSEDDRVHTIAIYIYCFPQLKNKMDIVM